MLSYTGRRDSPAIGELRLLFPGWAHGTGVAGVEFAVLSPLLLERPTASAAHTVLLLHRDLRKSVLVPWDGDDLPDFVFTMEFLHSFRNLCIL